MYFYALLIAALVVIVLGKAMSALITIACLFVAFILAVATLRYIADEYTEAYQEPKFIKQFKLPSLPRK